MATALHHVNVCAPPGGAEAVARFYEVVLGFERLARPDTGRVGVWLGTGAAELHVSERTGAPHPDQHAAYVVDDIGAVRAAAAALDAVVRDDGPQRFFVRDPAGNLAEVLGHPDAAR